MRKEIKLDTAQRSQFLDITRQLREYLREIKAQNGVVTVFVPHTTAAVTVNENADPSVVGDLIRTLEKLIPHAGDYRHAEGNSDAHLKSSLLGCSLQLPVENGDLCLGTWQGVYFCEFDGPRSRKIWLSFIPA